MDEARAAIASARAAGAEQYAHAELVAAAEALARAEAAVAQRDYRLALNEALDAAARAGDATKAAAVSQAALQAEAEHVVSDTAAAVDRLKAAIAAAESARPPRLNRQAVSDARRTIVVANVALQKAREALGRRDHAGAKAACDGILGRLNGAMTAILKPAAPTPTERKR
jgi:hypothetical protein